MIAAQKVQFAQGRAVIEVAASPDPKYTDFFTILLKISGPPAEIYQTSPLSHRHSVPALQSLQS
jgi:hypothetical protein